MKGIDTNVIVRFLMRDNAEQAALANTAFADFTTAAPGFVCREVLVELIWVLQKIYRLPRGDIAGCADWSKAGELGFEKAYELINENCH